MNAFSEKPSCISRLKTLRKSLTYADHNSILCMEKVKEIVNDDVLTSTEKIIKLKEICKTHVK